MAIPTARTGLTSEDYNKCVHLLDYFGMPTDPESAYRPTLGMLYVEDLAYQTGHPIQDVLPVVWWAVNHDAATVFAIRHTYDADGKPVWAWALVYYDICVQFELAQQPQQSTM